MIGRLFYAIFFVCGGFVFAIIKWVFAGTKASRERKKILREMKKR